MQNLKQLETGLGEAADQLRASSRPTAGEYGMPALGLIFLRQATNRFYSATSSRAKNRRSDRY
jgi:type I restriction enzyme M protein